MAEQKLFIRFNFKTPRNLWLPVSSWIGEREGCLGTIMARGWTRSEDEEVSFSPIFEVSPGAVKSLAASLRILAGYKGSKVIKIKDDYDQEGEVILQQKQPYHATSLSKDKDGNEVRRVPFMATPNIWGSNNFGGKEAAGTEGAKEEGKG